MKSRIAELEKLNARLEELEKINAKLYKNIRLTLRNERNKAKLTQLLGAMKKFAVWCKSYNAVPKIIRC